MSIKKINIKEAIIDFTWITIGAFIAAVAIYYFMLPCNLTVGSGTAIAMLLNYYTKIPISIWSLVINVVLLTISFILIGPEFGIKTVYSAIMVPVFLGLFEIISPAQSSLTDDPFLDVICYILIVGVGTAILFSHNASSGGVDIIAKIMNKYLKMDLGQAVSLAGIVIALSSALMNAEPKNVVISVLGTYFGGIVLDYFIFGFGLKRKVCIISSKLDLFIDFILNDLHSGATVYENFGPYDKVSRKEIVTIVDKSEYRKLMDFIKVTDPKAFVTVYSVSEMQYQPKIRK